MSSRRDFILGALALTTLYGCAQRPPAETISINGAGATLPAPLYLKWFQEYNRLFPNVQVSYQPIGSVAGVKQFQAQTVDFGASDVGMTPEEMQQVARGVVMLPVTIGSIVLAYNLPGIVELKLSRATYVDLFLGKIKRWNDPLIRQDNPDLSLPDQEVFVIRRSDASGTTGIFTQHLSAISQEWRDTVGSGTAVQWVEGTIGSRGNEGVTAQVAQQVGAIGYLELTYAKQNRLPMARLQNKAGNYVMANTATVREAISTLQLPENLLGFVPDPEGANAYPIVTYSWLLLYKSYSNPAQSRALREVVNWCITEGQKFAEELGFVPLSPELVPRVQAALAQVS
ncbi:MAG: phosphate ABC transporter substrate-binding protein PstS [Pseudanabaenaceae cyanobacterium SKYGB_i_bin29]|nr:phosphate ABC transporter substrate-binding protein PstS [Pseudanabaenaceae cyanobacterium SKYG29]MDW8421086.1 phosphate ABC transporter substrate-binding protein PstS [Pseudanabaenaceae cyanobacterium SKYGB_i_bin29]